MTAGTTAILSLLLMVFVSAGRKRLGIPYEVWRVSHFLLAVAAVSLAFLHMAVVGSYFRLPAVQIVWTAIAASLLTVVLWVRFLRPWRLRLHPFVVTQARSEGGRTWRITVTPEGHPGFSFLPGQFAWLTFRASPFSMKEHPFSMASAPKADGSLEFAIKELGDFTRTMASVKPGQGVYVDGPYGSFSIDRHPDAHGYVFLAGGIGVAPIAGMLSSLADRGDARPHLLFSAHARLESIPLREEIDALKDRLDLKVVRILEEPPEDWTGEMGWIREEVLDRYLPSHRAGCEYFICGPVPMTQAVERSLRAVGVPAARIHSELFDLV
jgi:predicted ferric reductase